MINLLVFSCSAFALVFFIAWLRLPGLRVWIERPKYRFQTSLEHFDLRAQGLQSLHHQAYDENQVAPFSKPPASSGPAQR